MGTSRAASVALPGGRDHATAWAPHDARLRSGVVLVLADASDGSAVWLARELAGRAAAGVRLVTAEELAHGTTWVHRLGDGGVRTQARLGDGTVLTDDRVLGVVNRLTGAYLAPAGVSPQDARYAAAEFTALLLSWLAALPCRVLNPPAPAGVAAGTRGAAGARSAVEWGLLAARSGFAWWDDDAAELPGPGRCPHQPWDGPPVQVLSVAGRVLPSTALPPVARDACARLAAAAGDLVLGVELHPRGASAAVFCSATPLPDLRPGGPALVDLILGELL